MKFEHLLQIYWARGFLYGSTIKSFDLSLNSLFKDCSGVAKTSQYIFVRRFECNYLNTNTQKNFLHIPENNLKAMNTYFSRIISINHPLEEILRYTLIRLYLIKSFRGRCQAIGKPARGQRTWSNAANAFNCNNILRDFLTEVRKLKEKENAKMPTVINYRKPQRKLPKKTNTVKKQVIKKKANLWF
jgi:ribosomal protein S13